MKLSEKSTATAAATDNPASAISAVSKSCKGGCANCKKSKLSPQQETMIIREILEALPASTKPVARPLHKGEGFKVMAIGLAAGIELKEHQTPVPAQLLVIKGSVVYRQNGADTALGLYDTHAIPPGVPHSVRALDEDSVFVLMAG